MSHSKLRVILQLICVAVAVAVSSTSATAQLEGKIADQPIGIWYMRGMDPVQMTEYFRKLAIRLSIGETMMNELKEESLTEFFSTEPDPLLGGAYYMVQGLLPSWEVMQFQQVASDAEALKMMKARMKQFGENGMLTTISDTCYKLSNTWSYKNPVPAGTDPEQFLSNFSHNSSGPVRYTVRIVEEGGVKYVEQSSIYEICFRFHDGMLYESNVDELFTMQLPSTDALTHAVDGTNDIGLELFFDRVPAGIKLLGWNMLNSGVGAQLQQRDDEPEQLYNLRKTSGDLILPLIRSVLFDVDQTKGWIRFATDDRPSIRAELVFKARRNAGLTQQLSSMSSARSRFAPILNDNAAITLHSCIQLPAEGKQVFESMAQFLLLTSTEVSDSQMADALQTLATAAALMGEQNCLEVLLKLGWSEASDGVVYGGIQTGNQTELVKSLYQLITNIPNSPPNIQQAVTLSEENGMPLIRIAVPPEFTAELQQNFPLKFSHVYFLQGNGCLWFAVGQENAVQMIRQSVDRCQQGGRSSQTSLVTLHFDGEQWLNYPQDDPAGVGGLLLWLDENANWFPPGPGPFNMGRMEKPVPLIQRVRELGGGEAFRITVDADESGLVATASMGEAIGNYYLARMIAWQDSMMARARSDAVESPSAINAEATEKAATPSPPQTTPNQ